MEAAEKGLDVFRRAFYLELNLDDVSAAPAALREASKDERELVEAARAELKEGSKDGLARCSMSLIGRALPLGVLALGCMVDVINCSWCGGRARWWLLPTAPAAGDACRSAINRITDEFLASGDGKPTFSQKLGQLLRCGAGRGGAGQSGASCTSLFS